MNNLSLYEKYKNPPTNALKPFDNGKFKGTDINSMWRIKSLTEEFGVCGIGWYYDIVKLWAEKGIDDQVLAFAEINLFIKVDGEWSKPISAVGGSQLIQKFKSYSMGNDECYKMAVTDAIGVACKQLGFASQIYWDNDKTKYTAEKSTVDIKKCIKEQAELLESKLTAEEKDKTKNWGKVKDLADLTFEQADKIITAYNLGAR